MAKTTATAGRRSASKTASKTKPAAAKATTAKAAPSKAAKGKTKKDTRTAEQKAKDKAMLDASKKKAADMRAEAAEKKRKEREAEKERKRKEREAKEAEKKAAAEKKEQAKKEASKKLEPLVKNINVRFEKAAKLEGQADDHRLAAAIHLGEARTICDEAGIPFREWAEKNIVESVAGDRALTYETVRKLAYIGQQDDPAAALAESRQKNAAQMKKAREQQKGNGSAQALPAPEQKDEPAPTTTRKTPASEDGEELWLDGANAGEVIELAAAKADSVEVGTVKALFGKLKAHEQMDFVKWAAKECGGEFKSEFDLPAEG